MFIHEHMKAVSGPDAHGLPMSDRGRETLFNE